MKLISTLLLLMSLNSLAQSSYSVMTFNTMCDLCLKDNFDDFDKRIEYIKETVSKYSPDLISLQEVRTSEQVKDILSQKKYEIILTENIFLSYADPALGIKKSTFEILERGQFWLGPGEGISVGWKVALPRQVHWVKLRHKIDKNELYFIGSHFDNRIENLLGSRSKVREFVKELNLPFIFAADTNIPVDSERYPGLVADVFTDSFDLVDRYKVNTNNEYKNKDLCYRKGGRSFPTCRVDHILLSQAHSWKVLTWEIDTFKFGADMRFASDHRAIYAKITLD